MQLTSTTAARYLLDRGRLSPRAFVRGELKVVESHRRNRNFKIVSRLPPSLFVKQVREPGDAAHTVTREAALLRRVATDPELASLARLVPRFVDFDPRRLALVLELAEGESAFEHMMTRRTDAAALGEALGAGLGACHRSEAVRALGLAFASMVLPPWPLRLGDGPPASLPPASPSHRSFIAALRHVPELVRTLAELRATWRPNGLVHDDVKLDNIVWDPATRLVLADWELVDYGDVDWDVGAALQGFLVPWLLAVPWDAATPLPQQLERASFSIDSAHQACRAFWRAYVDARGVPPAERPALRDRCVRYAAVRLLQTGFEHLQGTTTTTGLAHALIPCSLHMLRDPRRAGVDLFGLPDAGE